jgi:hypothetical protein
MSELFEHQDRVEVVTAYTIPDISGWNTQNVISMDYMFTNADFNGNISGWVTDKVESMSYMYVRAPERTP